MSGHKARAVIAIKTESSAGTYTDPTSSGTWLYAEDFDLGYGGEPLKDRSATIAAYPGAAPPKVGAFFYEVSMTVPAFHWGDTDDATDHPHAILFGAGPSTITAGASDGADLTVRPDLSTSSASTFSMAYQAEGGNLYKMRGCRAIVEEISGGGVGDTLMLKVKIQGLHEATPAAGSVNFASVTYGDFVEVTGMGATMDVGVSGACGLANWTMTTGQIFRPRVAQEEAYGYKIAGVGHNGYAKLSVNLEEVVESTFAVWAAALAKTEATATLTFPGPGSETFAVNFSPKTTPDLPKLGERDDNAVYELELHSPWDQGSGYHYGLTYS